MEEKRLQSGNGGVIFDLFLRGGGGEEGDEKDGEFLVYVQRTQILLILHPPKNAGNSLVGTFLKVAKEENIFDSHRTQSPEPKVEIIFP